MNMMGQLVIPKLSKAYSQDHIISPIHKGLRKYTK